MSIYYQEKWDALEAEINRRGANGAAVVEAIKDFYSIYENRLIIWLAKLYDPEIGGFYYSNSARDNKEVEFNGKTYPLLPDIESTNQATNFLEAHGIIKSFSEIPEKMKEQMYKFVSERLDPETGFIYHPQWPKELTDSRPGRRGRDITWAEAMAEKFDWKYSITTANERLFASQGNDESVAQIPEYLRTKEKLLEYLNSLDFENKPYWCGSEVAAQASPIIAAGLTDVVVDYFNSIQNSETGLWGKHKGYEAINGFMKITCFYSAAKRVIPNADKAAVSMLKGLMSDEPVETVCYQYNGWYAVQNILQSLRNFGGEEGNKEADKIVTILLNIAPDAIRATKEKVLVFKKTDGTFSYAPNETCCTSMGMPVALPQTNEGDVNASGICSNGTLTRMYAALELEDYIVPTFASDAYKIFLENLNL